MRIGFFGLWLDRYGPELHGLFRRRVHEPFHPRPVRSHECVVRPWRHARANLVNSPGCTPAVPDFALDAQAQSVIAPTAGVCATSITPVIRVRNNGEQTLTSLDVTYSLDGVEIATVAWTGTLACESEDVTLTDISPADGNHIFSFTCPIPMGAQMKTLETTRPRAISS